MSCLRLALLALVCAARVLAQATLTVENFNNPGATGAVILGTSWANQVTRSPDTITVAGTAKDGVDAGVDAARGHPTMGSPDAPDVPEVGPGGHAASAEPTAAVGPAGPPGPFASAATAALVRPSNPPSLKTRTAASTNDWRRVSWSR
jgi:hypothetical protein